MTYFYTILDGNTVRIPICPVTFRYDETEAEPWNEPPLITPLPVRKRREMMCNKCCRSLERNKVGPCKCGGWMRRR